MIRLFLEITFNDGYTYYGGIVQEKLSSDFLDDRYLDELGVLLSCS